MRRTLVTTSVFTCANERSVQIDARLCWACSLFGSDSYRVTTRGQQNNFRRSGVDSGKPPQTRRTVPTEGWGGAVSDWAQADDYATLDEVFASPDFGRELTPETVAADPSFLPRRAGRRRGCRSGRGRDDGVRAYRSGDRSATVRSRRCVPPAPPCPSWPRSSSAVVRWACRSRARVPARKVAGRAGNHQSRTSRMNSGCPAGTAPRALERRQREHHHGLSCRRSCRCRLRRRAAAGAAAASASQHTSLVADTFPAPTPTTTPRPFLRRHRLTTTTDHATDDATRRQDRRCRVQRRRRQRQR